MKRLLSLMSAVLLMCGGFSAPARASSALQVPETKWTFGFARRQIIPDAGSTQPLYIAGYNNGMKISGVLDLCETRALWLDAGGEGILLIGIDCVALSSGTVEKIRAGLSDVDNCLSINVYATHTHAGPDTLGLWGPVGVDGKNDLYMQALIDAAIEAGHEAASEKKTGEMYYGFTETRNMQRDSRYPEVYDANLYQLRLAPDDGTKGVRMYFYGAHAESLRGSNSLLSRDFPGMLCDGVQSATGDDAMFFPGAVGGLIMTREFVSDTDTQAVENLNITAQKLIGYALSINADDERQISPQLTVSRKVFTVPLDNPAFLLYRMIGILNNKSVATESSTGYGVETELSVMMLDDLALTLIPGEIFPELVSGEAYGDMNPNGINPAPLMQIANSYGIRDLLVIGLANDELGYIIPPSDFLLNENAPYIERIIDARGEDHYEETNSVGPQCAQCIADAFESALSELDNSGGPIM